MNIRRNIRPLAVILLACILVWPAQVKAEETRVSIYIAVSGVCGGLYFFLSYTSGYLPFAIQDTALLNRGPEGWQVGFPMIALAEGGFSAGEPYLELLTVRF
ncbi:MAG: hypothetical protein SV487_01265 [Thermodesulfobacteriota bacterium]|nr:hypothetical protein [Thermodesulfobacteriota bacterium]